MDGFLFRKLISGSTSCNCASFDSRAEGGGAIHNNPYGGEICFGYGQGTEASIGNNAICGRLIAVPYARLERVGSEFGR
jgi:hypothetical protein